MKKQAQKRHSTKLNRIFCIKPSFDRVERKGPENRKDKDGEAQHQNDGALEIEPLTNLNDTYQTSMAEEVQGGLILILQMLALLYWNLPHLQSLCNSKFLSLLSLSKTETPSVQCKGVLFSYVFVVERVVSEKGICQDHGWSGPLISLTYSGLMKSAWRFFYDGLGYDANVALFCATKCCEAGVKMKGIERSIWLNKWNVSTTCKQKFKCAKTLSCYISLLLLFVYQKKNSLLLYLLGFFFFWV